MHSENGFMMHFFNNKELDEIYIGTALRSFAISMISLFVPIYFWKLGYSFIDICVFYILLHVFGMIISIPLTTFSLHKIGLKHTLLLHVPFFLIFFWLLYGLETTHFPLWILALSLTFGNMFYWIPFHINFAKSSSTKSQGAQLGMIEILTFILKIFGPLIGGILISTVANGFQIIFILSGVLLLISGIVYLYTEDYKEPEKVKMREIVKYHERKDVLSFFGEMIRSKALAVLWPLFIFIALKDAVMVGSIAAVSNLLLVIITSFLGKFSDTHDKKKMLKYGGFAHAITIIFRGFASSAVQMALFQGFGAFTFAFINIPYKSIVYLNSKKRDIAKYIIGREFLLRIFSASFFAVLALLYLWLQDPLLTMSIGFVIGAFGSLIMTNISENPELNSVKV